MSLRRFHAPGAESRLADYGLRDIADLLMLSDDGLSGSGEWTLLSKPGLVGRRRFRWRPLGEAGPTLYVKQFYRTPLRRQIDRMNRQTVRHSHGWWEFRQCRRLRDHYLPVPNALAAVEDMRGIFERRSAVVIESVRGDAFDRVWPRLLASGSPWTRPPLRHDLIGRVARVASALHQSGYCHRDLYLCHIFVEMDAAARQAPQFSIIDLGRTHAPRIRRMRWIVKDLAQLDVSARQLGATRADRYRFLLAYLGLQPKSRRSRVYARRIVRKADGVIRRIGRKKGVAK